MSDQAPATAPVTDWLHDFDHTDPRWTENPYPIWDELRAQCPVVHTERFLGVYLPTSFEAVKEISYDTNTSPPAASSSAMFAPKWCSRRRRSPPIRPSTSRPSGCCCRRSRRMR
jgi:cytochrome P450